MCLYAHGQDDIGTWVRKPEGLKTKLCWFKSNCQQGTKCMFIHSAEDLYKPMPVGWEQMQEKKKGEGKGKGKREKGKGKGEDNTWEDANGRRTDSRRRHGRSRSRRTDSRIRITGSGTTRRRSESTSRRRNHQEDNTGSKKLHQENISSPAAGAHGAQQQVLQIIIQTSSLFSLTLSAKQQCHWAQDNLGPLGPGRPFGPKWA